MTTITIPRALLEQALANMVRAELLYGQPNQAIQEAIRAALSAPATAPEQCWCRTCRPITQADNRKVLCPDCGNKRCPKATDHRNACTGSNEPGQPGSSYPTVPATAPEHLDPADLCDVCKEPVRYGSRHHACGEAMLRAKANAAPATAPVRKPMTDEDTLDLFSRIQLRMRFTDADARPFASGVASAEFFHGIK